MQPAQSSMLRRTTSGIGPRVTTSETANRPPGFSTRKASRSTLSLSRRQIDHAVGDDHVDRIVGQRDRLDLALEKLNILRARLLLVLAGEREHVVGHVEAVGLAGRPNATRREQNVDAAARAEIENGLARPSVRPTRSDCRSPGMPPRRPRARPTFRPSAIEIGRNPFGPPLAVIAA